MTLGIIGTAGRGSDAAKLTAAHWRMMVCIGQTVATTLGAHRLVSGGSAWADHVVVQLYLDGWAKELSLHLPCRFHTIPGTHTFDRDHECGARLNELHGLFQRTTGINPFDQIAEAIKRGAEVVRVPKGASCAYRGFKERNTGVANEADALLPFTLNPGASVGDSGTADTVAKYLARFAEQARIDGLNGKGGSPAPRAFHFSLVDHRLYAL